jgi:hypothetical protein
MHTEKFLTSVRRFVALTVLAVMFAAQPAHALPLPVSPFPVDLEIWMNAVNGDAAAIAIIDTQLASNVVYEIEQIPDPGQTYDMFGNQTEPFLPYIPIPVPNAAVMTFADMIADPTLPPEFLDPVLLASAVAGDRDALSTLQATLPATNETPALGPLTTPAKDLGVAHLLLYKISAGTDTGNGALGTLLLALRGDAQAGNIMQGLYGPVTPAILLELKSNLGCGDTEADPTAAAYADDVIDRAWAGEPASIALVQYYLYQQALGAQPNFADAGTAFIYEATGTYDPDLAPAPTAPCQVPPSVGPGDDLTVGDLSDDVLDMLEDNGIDPQEYVDQQNELKNNIDWDKDVPIVDFIGESIAPFGVIDAPPGPPKSKQTQCADKLQKNKAVLMKDHFKTRDPCTWTRDNKEIEFAQEHQAGYMAVKYLSEWWAKKYLPALKNMTAQLHSSYINQTLIFGELIDGLSMTKVKEVMTQREQEQIRRNMPNQKTCLAASHTQAKARATKGADDLRDAATKGVAGRAGNAPGSTAARGSLGDRAARFQRFCKYFMNPASNAGQWDGVCPTNNAGPLMDADINIEGFLFKDTINMNNENERNAALAIVDNLIEPEVLQQLFPSAIDSVPGQAEIMRREHLKALHSVPAAVVASIVSRRSSIPGASVNSRVAEIRRQAGVPNEKISSNPSYNEIMLAMTKERFFVPDYYAHIAEDKGAMKQEQTSVNAYITLQMQDIQTLQEQINALMAVRASIRLEKMKLDAGDSSAPGRPFTPTP